MRSSLLRTYSNQGRSRLIVEPHHHPAVRLQVGHDESDSGEQLPKVELHLTVPPFLVQSRGEISGFS